MEKTELDTAMADLDALAKSGEVKGDELDELTKALEAELAGDPLKKSEDGDDEEPDDDEDDEMEKAKKTADAAALAKSQEDLGYEEELIRQSEAFASLEKSVQDLGAGVAGEIDSLKKSLAALLNLNIKQAQVIASLAKSRQEDSDALHKSLESNEAITKSLETLGARPVIPNKAVIGSGNRETEILTKSHQEISEALQKAVSEKRVSAFYLSSYGTHRDVNRFPDDVRKEIGL